jgi:hypothetical protein
VTSGVIGSNLSSTYVKFVLDERNAMLYEFKCFMQGLGCYCSMFYCVGSETPAVSGGIIFRT